MHAGFAAWLERFAGRAGTSLRHFSPTITPKLSAPRTSTSRGQARCRRSRGPTLHFAPTDAEFLFIPEAYHGAAKKFFHDLSWDYGGPVFLCPYIDPTWDMARIQKELAAVPAASTP